jgi:hypothetical protein
MSNRPLSVQDLADRWGVPTRTIVHWRQQGTGPCFIQIGRLVRYPVAEVEAFERQLRNEPRRGISIPINAFIETLVKKIGRLRRPKFTEQKSQAIVQAYLRDLLDRQPSACPRKTIDEYTRLMTPCITVRDPDEIQMECTHAQSTPEVLFVDLINNLEKSSALVKDVLILACNMSAQLNRNALLKAVDQFGDMSTRRRIHALHRHDFKSAHDRRSN